MYDASMEEFECKTVLCSVYVMTSELAITNEAEKGTKEAIMR